ncbi:MAG: hypothetical protein V1688_04115 [bacterium]
MKKTLFTLIIVSVFIVVGLFLSTESYFFPYPYIDTEFSSDFSWENWNKIQSGMAKDEVSTLIGQPFSMGVQINGYYKIKSGENYSNYDCDVFSQDGALWIGDCAWISINVCYDNNGKVLGKNELIIYN